MPKGKKRSTDAPPPATLATSATNWDELPRPQTFQAAVAVASRLIAARLDANPKARWRIRIDRTEPGPPRIWLKTDQEGCTRAEFFARIAAGNRVLSVADRAMANRLQREEGARAGAGRPKRAKADLQSPAGQSRDALVFETCLALEALGWKPLSRASQTGGRASIFDAVAEAMRANDAAPRSYSGTRDAWYRVSSKGRDF